MSYRVRRKFTSTTFCIDGQLCKLFLKPESVFEKDFYLWNVALAVGKSNRQLNDWYHTRKNKRARSIQGKIVGRSGVKIIQKAYEKLFGELRWLLEPGDCLTISCKASGEPDKQFYAFWRWISRHSDMAVDYENKSYYWYRPPFSYDAIYKDFKISPITPEKPMESVSGSRYFDCFRIQPKVPCTELSMGQITGLLSQALATEPCVETPI